MKVRSEVPRIQGFNGDKLRFLPGEEKDVSTDDMAWLVKDPAFVALLAAGDFLCPDLTSPAPVEPEPKTPPKAPKPKTPPKAAEPAADKPPEGAPAA